MKRITRIINNNLGGGVFVSADFNALEIFILAAISNDETLKEALVSGGDIHCANCRRVFPEMRDKTDKEIKTTYKHYRNRIKALIFGLVYGKSAGSFARDVGITRDEGVKIYQDFFDQFPGIKTYIDRCHSFAKEHGYIDCPMGKRRFFSHLDNPRSKLYNHELNASQNHCIQASASQLATVCSSEMALEFRKRGMWSVMSAGVHDSIEVSAYPGELIEVLEIMNYCMTEQPTELYDWLNGIKLRAEPEIGVSWEQSVEVSKIERIDDKSAILTMSGGDYYFDLLEQELSNGPYEFEIMSVEERGDFETSKYVKVPQPKKDLKKVMKLKSLNAF